MQLNHTGDLKNSSNIGHVPQDIFPWLLVLPTAEWQRDNMHFQWRRETKEDWVVQTYVMTTLFNWSSYGDQNEDKTLQRSQFCHKGEFRHVSISARQQSLRFGQNVRWSCLYLQGYPVRKAKSYKPILQTTLRNNIFGAHVLETFKRMLATGCLNESNLPTCKNCSISSWRVGQKHIHCDLAWCNATSSHLLFHGRKSLWESWRASSVKWLWVNCTHSWPCGLTTRDLSFVP